jgi:hypothetical protein
MLGRNLVAILSRSGNKAKDSKRLTKRYFERGREEGERAQGT